MEIAMVLAVLRSIYRLWMDAGGECLQSIPELSNAAIKVRWV